MLPPIRYAKPHLPLPAQLALLRSRGLRISDPVRAANYLQRIGYYRLSGYWHPLRQRQGGQVLDSFVPGAEFQAVADLYVFDKRLRLLFLDALERIEVGLRVEIALSLGRQDAWVHRDVRNLHPSHALKVDQHGRTEHGKWLTKLDETATQSREEFVIHFRTRYPSDHLPIWIAIELWDFGMLSRFIGMMRHPDCTALGAKCGMADARLLQSWVRSWNNVRNICAHHGRLWNRVLTQQPAMPRTGAYPALDHLVANQAIQPRLYGVACTIQQMMKTINPTSTWADRLKEHFATFPAGPLLNLRHSGFPPGWEAQNLWN